MVNVMTTITRTHTVQLSAAEAAKILCEALGLPITARVDFKIGTISQDIDDRYDVQGCVGVSLSHEEVSEIELKPKSVIRAGLNASQFEDRDWNDR